MTGEEVSTNEGTLADIAKSVITGVTPKANVGSEYVGLEIDDIPTLKSFN